MRYLIDPEFRTAKLQKPVRSFIPYAAELRRELSLRNLRWAPVFLAVSQYDVLSWPDRPAADAADADAANI